MAKWKWLTAIGGVVGLCSCCLASCVVFGFFVYGETTKARERVTKADGLWDAGKKAEAVTTYKDIAENGLGYIEPPKHPQLFARIIETDLEKRDLESAQKYLKIARDNKVAFAPQHGKDNPKLAALLGSKELLTLPCECKDKLTDKDTPCRHVLGYVPQTTRDNPSKIYEILLSKGETIIITMKSSQVDSFVIVEDFQGKMLNYNDDDPNLPVNRTLHSWLRFTAPDDGLYRVSATCTTGYVSRKHGEFELTIARAK